mmetsp:Transcript_32239/g.67799  ORF Transcript_32239/g.67799 Transcript_32239/m.67799 type:complete len:391 (-) Transcript_32239:115-1287(-)
MQYHKVILVVVSTFACSLFLIQNAYFYRADVNKNMAPPRDVVADAENQRSLRLDQYRDLNIVPRTITIYLLEPNNLAFSIFKTDIFQRYGSGQFNFLIQEGAECGHGCHLNGPPLDNPSAPCVTVNRGGPRCLPEHVQCQYPQCKRMITNDEFCRHSLEHDIREYYSSNLPGKIYLPLGPRFDSWTSFQMLQQSPHFIMRAASKRKFAFNAIFSKNTSPSREVLAKIIEENTTTMPTYASISEKWHVEANSPHTEQLHTDEYIKVVLDSVFTLTPRGHNPECFRLFEAVEAGSIPVMVKDDLYIERNTQHPCTKAMQHWYDAPIVVLDHWADLYPTTEKLVGDLAALDEMQIKLRIWYDEYMTKAIREFEDFMFQSYEKDATGLDLTERR